MEIKFYNSKELNNFISKYIEDRIAEIVLYYVVDVIDVLEAQGYTVIDKNANYVDEVNNRDVYY